MRRLVWVVALFLIAAFFLLIFEKEGKMAEKEEKAPVSFGIYSSELADSGGSIVAVLHLFLFSEKGNEISAFCSERPIAKNVIILEHASVPGMEKKINEMVKKELSKIGFSSRNATLENTILTKNSIIIAPNGAVPSGFVEREGELREANNRVIVIEMLEGRMIDELGNIAPYNRSSYFENISMAPGKEEEAAKRAAEIALAANEGERFALAGNYTVIIPVNSSEAYCRAVYEYEGKYRFADTDRIRKPDGSLVGPASIYGRTADFEFSPSHDEIGRNLRFSAVAYREREKSFENKMAGGEILEGWASKFSLSFNESGKYLVKVVDQFARLHASAYIEALGLDVIFVSREGSKYVFRATVGEKPVNGNIKVWIDEGKSMEFYAANGTLVVWAAPPAGKRVMHFEFEGMRKDYEFIAEEENVVGTYVRYGVPSLIFLLAVYFLIRAGRRTKYSITFPQFASLQSKAIDLTEMELIEAYGEADKKIGGYGLVAFPNEIAAALKKGNIVGATFCKFNGVRNDAPQTMLGEINLNSLIRALRKLHSFAEHENAFIPKKELSGFSPKEIFVLRLLHDAMLEHGYKFKRNRVNKIGKNIEIVLFGKKEDVLKSIGKGNRVILFESESEKEEFEKGLDEPNEMNIKIKLMLSNGKLTFISANKSEIDGVLP